MRNPFKLLSAIAALVLLCATVITAEGDDGAISSEQRARVEAALSAFVNDLSADPPSGGQLSTRIRAYVEANPTFYGSTVAMIGDDGRVSRSPYVYRHDGATAEVELVTPAYEIDQQAWLVRPRDAKMAVWTDPYFDAGGGNIWMVTRSVPLIKDGKVYAVATTDLPVPAPKP